MNIKSQKSVEILLIEDSQADTELIRLALEAEKILVKLHVAKDGIEALDFLKRKGKYAMAIRPDLILLDLNLPKKDGREVLAEVKSDPILGLIPVVVLSSSAAEEDIFKSYKLHANAYIIKPIDFESFRKIVAQLSEFWFSLVVLPPKKEGLND